MTNNEDWSEAIGLKRAAISVLIRSAICLPIWAAFIWFITPAVNQIPMSIAWFAVMGLILAIPSVALAHALSRGLIERAGFVSPIVTVIAVAFACGVIYGGGEIAGQFRELVDWRIGFIQIAAGLFTTLWIAKTTLFES